MARSSKSAKTARRPVHQSARREPQRGHRPTLRAVGSHKADSPSAVSSLLSGRVSRAAPKTAREKRKARPAEALPPELAELSDVYAAGKTVQKELEFKVRYAEERVKTYCVRKFAELYAAGGKRPSSIDVTGARSRFLFTQTDRVTVTLDKVEELRESHVPIDEYTELRGIRVNYEAIRRHGIEKKLQDALSGMGLPPEVLEECFVPNVELKESFFELLDRIAERSARQGESIADKLHEILIILRPANQIRNLEIPGLDAQQSFDLVMNTEVTVPDEEEEVA